MVVRSVARILTPLLFFALVSAAAPVRAADDPAGFIADLGTPAIDVLTSQRPEAERENQFRILFREGFDLPFRARTLLDDGERSAA